MMLVSLSSEIDAQIVDGILGQRREVVQVALRPYRIIDYKKDRVVYTIEEGIHQTTLLENDTCRKFYWAISPEKMDYFKGRLVGKGYAVNSDGKIVKDSLELSVRPLPSGKATLFIASLSKELKGDRDASGKRIEPKEKTVGGEPMPLLQQAILQKEKKDSIKPKRSKDPRKHWVGSRYGNTSILGWD